AEPWALPFRRSLARSERITVTGTKMKHGLIERGLSSDRIHVLPHSVDLTRFRPRNVPTRYDVLSVGQLIVRKRMDLLIEAVGILKERGLLLQLGILGRGPEEARLRQQIERLGLTRQVELLAYRDDVE